MKSLELFIMLNFVGLNDHLEQLINLISDKTRKDFSNFVLKNEIISRYFYKTPDNKFSFYYLYIQEKELVVVLAFKLYGNELNSGQDIREMFEIRKIINQYLDNKEKI